MASEYLKWKYREVQPEEKAVLTKAEQRKNWWHYHKWYIIIGAVLILALGNILWSALGIGQVTPDYQIAYVGTTALPDDTVSALETAVAGLGEDLNGDGNTVVKLVQYVSSGEDVSYAAAAEVTIMADLIECESYFFLLDDPKTFQQKYHALCYLDGSLPPDEEDSVEKMCLLWEQCPMLANMELGEYSYSLLGGTATGSNQELLSQYYIARRGFWQEETVPYPEECAALWTRLTEGAVL